MHKIKFAIAAAAIGVAVAAPARADDISDTVNMALVIQTARDDGFTCQAVDLRNVYCFKASTRRAIIASTEPGLANLIKVMKPTQVCEVVSKMAQDANRDAAVLDVKGTYLHRLLMCGMSLKTD